MTVTLKKKPLHVCIALPSYTGQVWASTMQSIVSDVMLLASKGIRCTMNVKTGNADIADCRAMLVAEFLAGEEFTHLLFVDWDVTWPQGGLPRLLSHNVDMVCGLYPKRSDPVTFDFRSEFERGADMQFQLTDKGLMEVWGVPAGFLLVKREALEKMAEAYEALSFKVEHKHIAVTKAWDLFETYRLEDGAKIGEDYAFCQRWRDIGGKVYIDPGIPMGHIGYKVFQGSLGHTLEATTEKDEAA